MRHPRHGPPDGLPAHDDAGDLLESAALTPPKTLQWACFPSALQPITMRKVTPRRRPSMPNDTNGLTRFLGGSPVAVAFRLILLSILVGVVLAAIGFDPWNILKSIRLLFQRIWDLGFDAINWLWRYFLLGAVIVIPVWLLMRLFGTPRRR